MVQSSQIKHMMAGLIIVIVLLTVGIVALLYEPSSNNDSGEDFTFIHLDGSKGKLSDYRGSVVLVDFWATWCTPCQYQMLELYLANEAYASEDLVILSINVDSGETLQDIEDFVSSYNDEGYPLSWVFGNADDTLPEKYMPASAGIPRLLIFDRQGNLDYQESSIHFYEEIPSGYSEDLSTLKEHLDPYFN